MSQGTTPSIPDQSISPQPTIQLAGIAISPRLQYIARMGILPALFYFAFFCLLTYPLILHFWTDCLCNPGDGYQYQWNMWWTNKAVTQLHQLPWQTSYWYYPRGFPLMVHDFYTFSGILGLVLLRFLALPQAYNVILIAGFVLGGLVMFWLAYRVTGSYAGSLLAGFVFTFSNDHFAHAILSHLTLISIFWLPLFTLLWLRFLTKPTYKQAALAALVLLGVTLTAFTFVLFCIYLGVILALWQIIKQRDLLLFLRPAYLRPTLFFIALTLLTSGIFILSPILLNRSDPITVDPYDPTIMSGRDPKEFSVDLLALLIPGGKVGSSLLSYWNQSQFVYRSGEHNAYPGLIVWGMLLYVLINFRHYAGQNPWPWYGIWFVFLLLSLGPVLHIIGVEIPGVTLPYAWLENIVPLIASFGEPARLMMLSLMAASVIVAYGFKLMIETYAERRWVGILIVVGALVIMTIDQMPLALPVINPPIPKFVEVLRDLPGNGAVLDSVTDDATTLYYQMVHEKPITFAYTSRVTQSLGQLARDLKQLLKDERYERLCPDYGFAYLVVPSSADVISKVAAAKSLYSDAQLTVYDLGCIVTSDAKSGGASQPVG